MLVIALAVSAWAQGGTATISGVVYDQDKAVLPGATVIATNEATGIARETVTGSEGRFILPTLNPGTYSISIEMPGFQNQMREGLGLRIGQEVTIDFSLSLAGVAENVTVTGQAPLVEATASRVGSNVSEQEIDQLPSQGRNHLSLMQLVPGLVPELTPGEFEGGNFNANGRDVSSNLWSVDGAANQDTDGGGTGPQARITLDSMAEFQVLTHNYTAEFGGSSGVIINAVTKSGANQFSGRGFYYLEDESLRAKDPFLDEGEDNPESGRNTFGFNIGGPIVRNKAFFFFNLERNLIENAVVHTFPEEAASIATNYADASIIHALSTFGRVDYTRGNDNFSFRYQREVAPAVGEDFECCQTLDNRQIELDSNDRMINVGWTRLIGSRATNEFKFSHVGEDRVDGNLAYMGVPEDQWNSSGWISGLQYLGPDRGGRDQFDIGSLNEYSDFATGPAAAHGGADSKNFTIQNALTFATASGKHTFKTGFNYNRVEVSPQRIGANDNGTFSFQHNLPFNPNNAFTYPSEFGIVLGNIEVFSRDDWYSAFFQDQWRVSPRFTLNLGLRWDYQDLNSETKDGLGPRVGFAYDLTGDAKTVIRGGFGRFYEYHVITLRNNLNRRGIFGQTFTYQTDEDLSPEEGIIPADPCLQPIQVSGRAAISPACRAVLTAFRDSLQPGAGAEFINTEPQVDGDREMGYLWGYSIGVKREVMPNLAVGVDYVGNRGRNLTGLFDISEGPADENGEIRRLTVDEFDPSGTLVPASARGANFRRFLQYQTTSTLNSEFDSLELSLEKRMSDRWSSRVAYTLAKSNDVGVSGTSASGAVRFSDDRNPRADFGRSNFDNRHAFVTSVNVQPWGGLSVGGIFKYYSGYPINELIGEDFNGDRDNNDRPIRGIHDTERAIVSDVDANGRAIRNGIDGESVTLMDLQFQYVQNLPRRQTIGFFWEIYNAFNKINYANPSGDRSEDNFLVPEEAGSMRSMQLGLRYTF